MFGCTSSPGTNQYSALDKSLRPRHLRKSAAVVISSGCRVYGVMVANGVTLGLGLY